MKMMVEVKNLTKIFRIGKIDVPALRGVDLAVKEGEFLAIMGPSGCGKSTLLHIIGGLLSPTNGTVLIDGVDLGRLNDAQRTEVRRKKIGFIFQRFNLFPTLTTGENLDLARQIRGRNNGFPGKTDSSGMLKLLGLESKLNHRPTEMSGGEQQRVAIARAVVCRPALVLADEPTGNLDSENSKIVLKMLRELNRRYHQTIIMITHDLEAASVADRIVEMRDGQVLDRVQNLFYAAEHNGIF